MSKKAKNPLRRNGGHLLCFLFLLLISAAAPAATEDTAKPPAHSYESMCWKSAINRPVEEKKEDRQKKKITPQTVRLTVNEYYVPQVTELLNKSIDYFEWFNRIDDPYLNRYNLDVEVDVEDERLKLFWKNKF